MVKLMTRVAILGSTGMLGSTLTRVLENNVEQVYEFNRSGLSFTGNNLAWKFDVFAFNKILDDLSKLNVDYIINCVGLIKQKIDETNAKSKNLAYKINTQFPENLNNLVKKTGMPLIQIGTDCVFSGNSKFYCESDVHDSTDTYGLSKSRGEELSPNSMIIRCSIIGIENKSNNSLLGWVLSQPKFGKIKGYANHIWNGVTTLHYSQVVCGIIKSNSYFPGISHLVPNDSISKYGLIDLIRKNFSRSDLTLEYFESEKSINRTLSTDFPLRNIDFWLNAGYSEPPTIAEMISNYAMWLKK